MGFVQRVVPAAELAAYTYDYLGRVADNAPLTIQGAKMIVEAIVEDGGVAKQDEIAQLQLAGLRERGLQGRHGRVPREAAAPVRRPVDPARGRGARSPRRALPRSRRSWRLGRVVAVLRGRRAPSPRERGPAVPRAGPRQRARPRPQRGARASAPAWPPCRRRPARSLEIIVVDDGSTDRTPAILADAARRDPRVRVLRRGRPAAWLDREELRPRLGRSAAHAAAGSASRTPTRSTPRSRSRARWASPRRTASRSCR